MPSKNDRVELEMKIIKYRALARQSPDEATAKRINSLIAEDALTYQRMRDRTSRANRAVAADQHVRPDYGRCGDDASRSNLSPRPDHSSRINRYSAPKARSWMNG